MPFKQGISQECLFFLLNRHSDRISTEFNKARQANKQTKRDIIYKGRNKPVLLEGGMIIYIENSKGLKKKVNLLDQINESSNVIESIHKNQEHLYRQTINM